MKSIILFTNMSSIRKHWQKSIPKEYQALPVEHIETLFNYLKKDNTPILIMLDELSVEHIQDTLLELQKFTFAKVMIFNSVPEVHHASTLLNTGIKGYENAFIYKDNLKRMIDAVEAGHNWLFADLTNFIINQFVKSTETKEPDFMPILTEKEKDIAMMIVDGLSNKEIAFSEKIALSTVKGHISHIYEKAGVNDRVSLTLKFK